VLAQALAFSLPAPTTAAQGPAALQLWATHYYVHQAQAAAPGTSGVPLLDQAGRVLSRPISAKDWCGAAIEGTVQVPGPDGSPRTLNYAGTGNAPQVDCASATGINPNAKPWILATGRSHFSAARGPFGDGVAGYQLVPFRTVAVDRKTLPYGTVIFVPAARGVAIQLPDGRKLAHDGYFFAGDTGGAIQGTHIDVFCGVQAGNCFPGFVKSQASTGFAAQVVADEAIAQALRSAHGR
jgi:3D (Asp-Asp-Asp) domain-containing protein